MLTNCFAPCVRAVVEALEGLPLAKIHCSVLAEEAIKAAIQDYYDKSGIEKKVECRRIYSAFAETYGIYGSGGFDRGNMVYIVCRALSSEMKNGYTLADYLSMEGAITEDEAALFEN